MSRNPSDYDRAQVSGDGIMDQEEGPLLDLNMMNKAQFRALAAANGFRVSQIIIYNYLLINCLAI